MVKSHDIFRRTDFFSEKCCQLLQLGAILQPFFYSVAAQPSSFSGSQTWLENRMSQSAVDDIGGYIH